MLTPLRAPRINNNDDDVRLTRLLTPVGTAVCAGDVVAEIATDKAVFTVESERDGYVVESCADEGQVVAVGDVIVWLASTADERPPAHAMPTSQDGESDEPTLKARALLARHGLDARAVPRGNGRLHAADVQSYLARVPTGRGRDSHVLPDEDRRAAGQLLPLLPEERAMLRNVRWHQTAVPAYVEIHYHPGPWRQFADRFQHAQGLPFDPLLSLMACRLVELVGGNGRLNSTIVEDRRLVYDSVNLGFAVQGGAGLYLAVLRGADRLQPATFCARLGELQRRALIDALSIEEVTGATVAFSSMARWHVSRHVPILPPYTTLIVGHAATSEREGVLAATYDHRSVAGGDVAPMLQQLSCPPEER